MLSYDNAKLEVTQPVAITKLKEDLPFIYRNNSVSDFTFKHLSTARITEGVSIFGFHPSADDDSNFFWPTEIKEFTYNCNIPHFEGFGTHLLGVRSNEIFSFRASIYVLWCLW